MKRQHTSAASGYSWENFRYFYSTTLTSLSLILRHLLGWLHQLVTSIQLNYRRSHELTIVYHRRPTGPHVADSHQRAGLITTTAHEYVPASQQRRKSKHERMRKEKSFFYFYLPDEYKKKLYIFLSHFRRSFLGLLKNVH